MAPLLVRLYESHKLYSLAGDKSPESRAELTSAVTDLMETTKMSSREQELVADILTGLIRQAERDLKEALAERLCALDNVPLRLILQLAHEEISVSRHILTLSPVLCDLDLLYIIQSQGPEYWQAIAGRSRMGSEVVNALAETKDEETVATLIDNLQITLPVKAIEVIADLAKKSDRLMQPLLQREEIPVSVAASLYPYVAQAVKAELEVRFGPLGSVVTESISDVASELADSSREVYKPTPAMQAAAQNMMENGMLTTDLMVKTLKRGQVSSYIAMLSAYARLPVVTVENILVQPCGQGLAIVCKAFGIGKVDFVGMYLLTQKYRVANGVVDQNSMNKAIDYYERVKDDVALRLLKGSQVPVN